MNLAPEFRQPEGEAMPPELPPPTDPASQKRRDRLAQDFRPDAQYERLLKMRDEQPAEFDRHFGNGGMRIALGLYEAQRNIAHGKA